MKLVLKYMCTPGVLTYHLFIFTCRLMVSKHYQDDMWHACGWRKENGKTLTNLDLWLQVQKHLKLAVEMGLKVEVHHVL